MSIEEKCHEFRSRLMFQQSISTSLWEEEEAPPYKKRLFGTGDFPKWFDNLVRYIAAQIGYLVEHVPPTGKANVQEFNLT